MAHLLASDWLASDWLASDWLASDWLVAVARFDGWFRSAKPSNCPFNITMIAPGMTKLQQIAKNAPGHRVLPSAKALRQRLLGPFRADAKVDLPPRAS
jgi:hypothetical protein